MPILLPTLLAALLLGLAAPSVAQPSLQLPGYALTRVSDAVAADAGGIAQLAFDPASNAHLYAVRISGEVTRYDYAAASGLLTNALTVASVNGQPQGLGFHDGDLYVSFYVGGSCFFTGNGRITRFLAPDAQGVYQTRHDFVHSIPIGLHEVNQIQIVGDSLFVGIGAWCNVGDPAEENLYTMTLARVADLTQVDSAVAIDANFEGPVNYLAGPTEWIDPGVPDGQLRYYASGFRNPFGLAIGPGGLPWLSSNGVGDPGFIAPDEVYAAIPPGAEGAFPPASFGFGPPYIPGTPLAPLVEVGVGPSPTGFDFVPLGIDAGRVVMARFGAAQTPSLGRDLIRIDPDTASFDVLATGFPGPTDVVADPFGRLLVADLADGSIWLLEPPVTDCSDGIDNDGDGRTDYDPVTAASPGDANTPPAGSGDPACGAAGFTSEIPACHNGLDDDGEGRIDYDGGRSLDLDEDGFVDAAFNPATPALTSPDPDCAGLPWRGSESPKRCGLGFELAAVVPLLQALARRRRRARALARN